MSILSLLGAVAVATAAGRATEIVIICLGDYGNLRVFSDIG